MDQRTCQLVSEFVTCRDPLTLYKWTERCQSHVTIEIEFDTYVWMEVKVWYISWIVSKAVSLSIIPFFLSRIKLNGCKGTFTKGTDLVEFAWYLLCLSLPFPFLKKSLQNAPTSLEISSLNWGRNSPDFALFDGVHGTAQGTDKVSCKIWTVREGTLEIKCDNCNLFCKARKFYLKSPERGTSLDCVRRSWSSSPETCSDTLSTMCWRRWASCNS